MRTVEEAQAAILELIRTLPAVRLPLLEAHLRVLAEDVAADMDVPPFDNSAVDGYAVLAEDTLGATSDSPITLRTLRDIPAGAMPTETITSGTAARIMTGAPVPHGATAIVMIEDTLQPMQPRGFQESTGGRGGTVVILEEARSGQHIRRAGGDVRRGEVVLFAGTYLRSAEIGMLATLGRTGVQCVRAPRVAIISTGDEVVAVEEGVVPPPGKIRNSNSLALAALVREAGAGLHSMHHIPDDLDATIAVLRECADPETGADVIVAAGGVSVGDRDFVKPALEAIGTLDLWRVAMKPGKPLAFGRIDDTLFFGLPGNPVSAQVTFELFVRPALRKMMGRADLLRSLVTATLTESVSHEPGRREYVRAVTVFESGTFNTTPTGAQDSNRQRSMTLANSLLILPQEAEDLPAGTDVEVLLLDF